MYGRRGRVCREVVSCREAGVWEVPLWLFILDYQYLVCSSFMSTRCRSYQKQRLYILDFLVIYLYDRILILMLKNPFQGYSIK